VTDGLALALVLVVLAATLAVAVPRPPYVWAAAAAAGGAVLLVIIGAIGLSGTADALRALGPTVGFLAAMLLIADGCRREGLFDAVDLKRPRQAGVRPARPELPRFALAALALTLAGFAPSSVVGIEPVWFAAAGAAAITIPALARKTATPVTLARAAEPGFLIFVLGLGVIVQAASANGLDTAVRAVLPTGASLPDLLAIAALSSVFANLVNNLPATLMLIPVAATAAGPGPVLAVLIGVNVGPNLTYVGSLATLLWRRVLRAQDTDVELGEFLRLGALTVPASLIAATVLLWLALKA
jgi:arsenical pump membrane protein